MPAKDHSFDTDEQSPLISAEHSGNDGDIDDLEATGTFSLDDSIVISKSPLQLFLLTLGIGGLQIFWSVEFSNGSPYLLSLGMSKALVAFVWLAGPLTGVLVQPYIGIVSDRSRISWGKRKPFIVAGLAGTVCTSIILSYAKPIVWFLGPWSADAKYEGWWMGLTITLATILMWCLDFSINTAQAAIRAFIVDNAPAHQQEDANAWASIMTGVGNVFGYIFGYLNLAKHFHFLGNTQFRVLCVFASIAFSTTVIISVLFVKERNPQEDPLSKSDYERKGGIIAFFKQVFSSIKKLPPQIRSVCQIQFFQWMGWFPFLFYITTYIGQLYVDPYLHPDLTEDELDALWGKATRIATLALLICAIVSFSTNLILPFLIVPTYKAPESDEFPHLTQTVSPSSPIGTRRQSGSYSEIAYAQQSSRHYSGDSNGSRLGRMSLSIKNFLDKIKIPGLTLRRAWFMTQLLQALCYFSTFFISTPLAAGIMTAIIGFAWSLSLWAPFALISADIARRDEVRRAKQRRQLRNNSSAEPHASSSDTKGDNEEDKEDRAGIILGLHNVAVSSPQVLATVICSIVFKFLQKDRSQPHDTSIGWTLRMGGIAVLVAAFFTWRMKVVGEDGSDESSGSGNSISGNGRRTARDNDGRGAALMGGH